MKIIWIKISNPCLNSCIESHISKLDSILNPMLCNIPDIILSIAPSDTAWYSFNDRIMLSSGFFKLSESDQLFTIAHEIAHHCIRNGYVKTLEAKYPNKTGDLKYFKDFKEETLADFITMHVFKISGIESLRDNNVINEITKLKNLLKSP